MTPDMLEAGFGQLMTAPIHWHGWIWLGVIFAYHFSFLIYLIRPPWLLKG
jgi:hypothetical protein